MSAVVDASQGQVELQIALEVAASAGRERRISAPQVAGRFKIAERLDDRPGGRVDRLRIKRHVRRHAGMRPIRPREASVERTQIGPGRVAADNRLDVVVAVPRLEGANDARSMRQARQTRECRSIRHAGKAAGDLAVDAANAGGSRHLRVERFDLAGTAVHEQKDDGLVAERILPFFGKRAHLRQPRERKPAKGQSADGQKVAAGRQIAAYAEHAVTWRAVRAKRAFGPTSAGCLAESRVAKTTDAVGSRIKA